MAYSVGELARLTGVTVRTLHHYDDTGLLRPGARTAAGYRAYADADLERLLRVLCYRELGFGLDRIRALLDDPGTDALASLAEQHRLLRDRIERLQRMAAAVQRMLEARRMGINLEPDEIREVFGDVDPAEHAAEAEQRWGETDAYRESQRRTSSYTKADWQRLRTEAAAVEARLAAALDAGLPADGPEATAAAEEHRQHLSRWFYDCGYDVHRGLAEMYVADSRFAAHYDQMRPGLARYLRDAVFANADRAGG